MAFYWRFKERFTLNDGFTIKYFFVGKESSSNPVCFLFSFKIFQINESFQKLPALWSQKALQVFQYVEVIEK